jgi:protein gp37
MSKIEWTEKTWNPIVGCTKISAGCENCYAIRMAYRLMHNPATKEKYAGVAKKTNSGRLNWTGKINLLESVLTQPLRTKKPTIFFVNSMSDLFHENVPFHFIDKIFAVMAIASQHTFQILTKRPKRMLEYFNWKDEGMQGSERIRYQCWHSYGVEIDFSKWQWPLKNVWLGVSVENQQAANERIPLLLQTPSAVRFLSCEPLLGEVSIAEYFKEEGNGCYSLWIDYLDWVIVGGESGFGSRPMHPDWVRDLRDQCKIHEVPFFFKQWGEYMPVHDLRVNEFGVKGKQWFTFDPDTSVCKIGKKLSGRLLDGNLHNDFPINNGWQHST